MNNYRAVSAKRTTEQIFPYRYATQRTGYGQVAVQPAAPLVREARQVRMAPDGTFKLDPTLADAFWPGSASVSRQRPPLASASQCVAALAPAAPGVALTTDTGSSGSDHISNAGTLALSGVEAGALLVGADAHQAEPESRAPHDDADRHRQHRRQ